MYSTLADIVYYTTIASELYELKGVYDFKKYSFSVFEILKNYILS